jgi:hypothetical protein
VGSIIRVETCRVPSGCRSRRERRRDAARRILKPQMNADRLKVLSEQILNARLLSLRDLWSYRRPSAFICGFSMSRPFDA